jgi:DnaJ-class molecular chaperone
MPRSYYDILGVSRDAEPAAIKKAFRDLARKHHPDVNPDDPKAAERFKEVNHAHEILSDPKKRQLYDQHGELAEQSGFDPSRMGGGWPGGGSGGAVDLEDLLAQAFGGRRSRAPRKGRDRASRMQIDLPTAVLGGERTIDLGGEAVKVRIPQGIAHGGTLRLAGKGEPGALGGPPGDLRIEIEIAPDPVFTREGDDLRVELPITLGEALRGAAVEVPTMTTPVRLRVPPGSQQGRVLRVKGRGVSRPRHEPGDLLVALRVVLPDIGAQDVSSAIDALEALYQTDVRAAIRQRLAST